MVPVHNELAVLPALWARLVRLRAGILAEHDIRVVFVDDGSTDGSTQWLVELAMRQPGITLVQLDGAFGHQQALCAGLDMAPGDVVVTLDADLQDPPEIIAAMLALWQRGADVVYGVRQSRAGDSMLKRLCAAGFYRLLGALCGQAIPKDCGDFRLMDRQVVHAVERMPRKRPYLRGMVASVGCVQVALPYRRAARWAGTTSYAWPKMLKLAWAGLVSFAQPWRLSAWLAGLCAMTTLGTWLYNVGIGLVWSGAAMLVCAASGGALRALQWQHRAALSHPPCYRIARVVNAAPKAFSAGADCWAPNTDVAWRVQAQGCQD